MHLRISQYQSRTQELALMFHETDSPAIARLKELLAEMMFENRLPKKSVLGDGEAGI